MDKILLIDGLNSIYRASVSFAPPVKHEKINNICACKSPWNDEENFCYGDKYLIVYNFFRNLRPIIEMFSPEKCFFCLEGHPQFRYDLYPEYKANRIIKHASKPEVKKKIFEAQDLIVALLRYLPITICKADRFECDDVIGTLTENLKDEYITILSGDTDFIQLLQREYNNIQIYDPIKKIFMKAPSYPYVAGKAVKGDKSDNIKALLKPKKAEETISNPELFKKFLELPENLADFNINRKLIEFHPIPEEELVMSEGSKQYRILRESFDEMKFVSITNDKSWEKFSTTFDCLKF